MQCQSAEELGKRLKRRYERSNSARGMATGRSRQAEAELAEQLGRPLAEPVE